MTVARRTAVSGIFYPGEEVSLREKVQSLLKEAPIYPVRPTAIIVPHSTYGYSGSVAASAYASLKRFRKELNHIVILGAAHHNTVDGIAATDFAEFECPLGKVATNKEALTKLNKFDFVNVDNIAHSGEHSIEVQLPFLHEVLDDFTITPLIVGKSNENDIARIMEELSAPGTLFVVSATLSEYQTYSVATGIDRQTARSIELLDLSAIEAYNSLGSYAIKGLIQYAKNTDHSIKNIDYKNAGDTAGDKSRVIGYMASYCVRNDSRWAVATQEERDYLLAISYNTMAKRLGLPSKAVPAEPKFTSKDVDTFITLRLNGELRGCSGTLYNPTNLVDGVVANTVDAAFEDMRFTPLTAAELNEIDITVSILSPLEKVSVDSEEALLDKLRVGVDGVAITCGFKRGNFLPRVWEKYPEPQVFWQQLKSRLGLEKYDWSDDFVISRYRTCSFSLRSTTLEA